MFVSQILQNALKKTHLKQQYDYELEPDKPRKNRKILVVVPM